MIKTKQKIHWEMKIGKTVTPTYKDTRNPPKSTETQLENKETQIDFKMIQGSYKKI